MKENAAKYAESYDHANATEYWDQVQSNGWITVGIGGAIWTGGGSANYLLNDVLENPVPNKVLRPVRAIGAVLFLAGWVVVGIGKVGGATEAVHDKK